MRNRASNIIIGLCFIAAGVLLLGRFVGWWNFNIFFDGWWTLFIIIPSLASMIQQGINAGNIIGVGLGVLLLLAAQDVIGWNMFGRLVLPLVLVVIGISIIFSGRGFQNNEAAKRVNKEGLHNITAVLSGQNVNFRGQHFGGANITSVLGGVDLDLRDCILEGDVYIRCTTAFGGTDIHVPLNANIVVSHTPIFGALENKVTNGFEEGRPTVFIQGTVLFGGIEIK
ncbi:cell wall-active antibiotics response protein [Eubacteriales bacterium OttesenSCG-928-N14]|nr:cell wall-active antibiotics response protein [Eubacteriales bacterium OttesenSCG-928-N14]